MALALLACGHEPRTFSCTKDPVGGTWRACSTACVSAECFQRKEAHCFRNGPLYCTPTPEECNALLLSTGAKGAMCVPTQADEL